MKKSLVAGAAVAWFVSAPAAAVDLPLKAPIAAPMPIWNWTGFYLGGNVGGGMGLSRFEDPGLYGSAVTSTSGFFSGGLQAGYSHQFGHGLIGIEADVNGNSALRDSVLGGANFLLLRTGLNADVSGTIRARAGAVMNNTLLYVTGGAAWADIRQSAVEFNNQTNNPSIGQPTGVTANANGVLWGTVIGAGIEYALGPNWRVGAEFLHTMYPDRSASIRNKNGSSACIDDVVTGINTENCVLRSQLTTDVVRLRLNYRFGDAASTQAYAWAPATRGKTTAAVYNWTGFYVGGNAGGGMASSAFGDPGFFAPSATPTSRYFTGGAQAGYNYQLGHGMVGIEADVTGNSAFNDAVLGGSNFAAMAVGLKADVNGTIRGRAGVAVDNALLYVTGGAAWAKYRQQGTSFSNRLANFGAFDGLTADSDGTLWGGVVGAGIEYAVGSNWSVGGEFLHTMYGDRDASVLGADGTNICGGVASPANCVIRSQLTTSVARLRANYRFGEGIEPAAAYRPAAIAYNWTGFYVGGNAGGGMAASAFTDPGFFSSAATPTRGYFTGGVQAGYNYQFGKGLVGIEADVAGNGALKNSVVGGSGELAMAVGLKADVSGTIRARAGLVANNALLYVTGGGAWANVRQSGFEFDNAVLSPTFGQRTGLTANASATLWGGVIGAGAEFALSPNWTVGGEFLHTTYRDIDARILNANGTNACGRFIPADNCTMRSQLTTDALRLRFNYRFGG